MNDKIINKFLQILSNRDIGLIDDKYKTTAKMINESSMVIDKSIWANKIHNTLYNHYFMYISYDYMKEKINIPEIEDYYNTIINLMLISYLYSTDWSVYTACLFDTGKDLIDIIKITKDIYESVEPCIQKEEYLNKHIKDLENFVNRYGTDIDRQHFENFIKNRKDFEDTKLTKIKFDKRFKSCELSKEIIKNIVDQNDIDRFKNINAIMNEINNERIKINKNSDNIRDNLKNMATKIENSDCSRKYIEMFKEVGDKQVDLMNESCYTRVYVLFKLAISSLTDVEKENMTKAMDIFFDDDHKSKIVKLMTDKNKIVNFFSQDLKSFIESTKKTNFFTTYYTTIDMLEKKERYKIVNKYCRAYDKINKGRYYDICEEDEFYNETMSKVGPTHEFNYIDNEIAYYINFMMYRILNGKIHSYLKDNQNDVIPLIVSTNVEDIMLNHAMVFACEYSPKPSNITYENDNKESNKNDNKNKNNGCLLYRILDPNLIDYSIYQTYIPFVPYLNNTIMNINDSTNTYIHAMKHMAGGEDDNKLAQILLIILKILSIILIIVLIIVIVCKFISKNTQNNVLTNNSHYMKTNRCIN